MNKFCVRKFKRRKKVLYSHISVYPVSSSFFLCLCLIVSFVFKRTIFKHPFRVGLQVDNLLSFPSIKNVLVSLLSWSMFFQDIDFWVDSFCLLVSCCLFFSLSSQRLKCCTTSLGPSWLLSGNLLTFKNVFSSWSGITSLSLLSRFLYFSSGFRSLSICLDVDIFEVFLRFYSAFKICLSFTIFGMLSSIISFSILQPHLLSPFLMGFPWHECYIFAYGSTWPWGSMFWFWFFACCSDWVI